MHTHHLSKKYDLIRIGTTAVDLYFKGSALTHSDDRFQLAMGGKYFADEFHVGIGGGATNTATEAVRLGMRVALISQIGENGFKRMIYDYLDMRGVDRTHCQLVENYNNVSAILLNEHGEKTIVNYRNTDGGVLAHNAVPLELLNTTHALYMSNMPGVPFALRRRVLAYCHAHNRETYVNFGVQDCRKCLEDLTELLQYTTALIVNKYEYADIVKKSADTIDITRPTWHAQTLPSGLIVVVTDGERGSAAWKQGVYTYVPAVPVARVVNLTGAGDAYVAGFLASYTQFHNLAIAMREGGVCASKCISKD